jgi:hypothetical protein
VIVKNSTAINIWNNHFLPQIIEHKERPRYIAFGDFNPGMKQHHKVAGLNRLIGPFKIRFL